MLFSCCLGVGALVLLQNPREVATAVSPSAYDIEAIVEEDYINRTMLESASEIPMPLPLVAGHLDIRPGGLARFETQMDLGPLRPVFQGTVALRATQGGLLEVVIVEAQMGYLPVTAFIPSGLLIDINQAINQMLIERAGAVGVRVIGVTSDETTLRFYLGVAF
jgi:hypothetical protein